MKKTDVMIAVCVSAVLIIMISIGTASIYGDCSDITHQKSLKSSDPICINGNSNFTGENGVTGGNGTESNPFIIENLGIDASTANGIEIRDTDKHFIIRNCTVQGGSNNYGIYFYNVLNGKIDNVSSHNNDCGIYFDSSSNSSITNCTIYSNNDASIYFEESNNNSVTDCDVYNTSIAIYFGYSSGNVITSCIIRDNTGNDNIGVYFDSSNNNHILHCNICNNTRGVLFVHSSNNSITTSTIHYSNEIGIYLYESSGNNLANCDCYNISYGIFFNSSSNNNQITECILHNNNYSIYLYDSPEGNQITNSTLCNNSDYGICIIESRALSIKVKSHIYHNNFVNNGISAYDNSDNTVWDSNYWDNYTGIDANGDGIGDTPYNISGKTPPNQDRYPFMNPIECIPPIVESTLPSNGAVDVPVDTTITIVFSEPINKLSMIGNITIEPFVEIDYSLSNDNKTLTLILSSELSSYTNYNVTVNTNVKDLSQNSLQNPYNFSFRTKDVTPPVANAGLDLEVNEDKETELNASLSWDNVCIVNWTWSFMDQGEEVFLDGEIVYYIFTQPGLYVITLNVSDNAGNWAVDILNIIVKDVTPPVITILSPMNNTITNHNITLIYFVYDNFDDAENITITGPENNTVYSDEGEYTVTINATDKAGNNISQTIMFIIDKTPPTIEISEKNQTTTGSSFTIHWYPSEPIQYYEVSMDGEKWINISTNTYCTFTLSKGANTFYVKGKDLAGNTNTASVTIERIEEKEEKTGYFIYLIIIPSVFAAALIAIIAFLKRKIRIRCPACKAVFNVKPGKRPLKTECPKCGREGVLR